MIPLAFDGSFGWLHPAATDGAAPPCMAGVLLCGTIGFEKQCLHRPWRILAGELAVAGVPALRFDYPGTGDSLEPDSGLDGLEAWVRSIDAASAQLRTRTGVTEVVLCGIHLGAALAVEAAARLGGSDGHRLVLLTPTVSGRRYLRVLRVVASAAQGPPADEGWLEIAGLRLDQATRDALGRVELTKLAAAPAREVLILGQAASRDEAALAERLRDLGTEVTHRDLDGLDRLMADSHLAEAPVQEWRRIARWVREGAPKPAASARNFPAPFVVPRSPGMANAVARTALHPSGTVVEQPVRFGAPGRVAFGMYCAPRAPMSARPAVLFCNTGANPHYGPGRLMVRLARSLAEAGGVASLRVDLPGIGDGVVEPEDSAPHLYGTDRVPDIRQALDRLEALGHGQVVMLGVCSGAFHAVRAAVADSRVVGLVLVNQLLWHWRPHPVLALLRRLAGGAKRADIERQAGADAGGAMLQAQTIRTRVGWDRLRRVVMRSASAGNRVATRWLGVQTAWSFPERSIRKLSARGARVLLVAGQEDVARTVLEGYLGPGGRAVALLPGVTVRIAPGLDHAVASAAAGRTLSALLSEFLSVFQAPQDVVARRDAA